MGNDTGTMASTTLTETLKRENLAWQAFYRNDPEPLKALWSTDDDVSLFAGLGPSKVGWHEVAPTVDALSARFRDGTVKHDYAVIHEGTDLAFTVGYEHAEARLDNGAVTKLTVRVTQIYRRENADWRLIHRHGDLAGREMTAGPPAGE